MTYGAAITFRDLMIQTGMDSDAIAEEVGGPYVRERFRDGRCCYEPAPALLREIAAEYVDPFTVAPPQNVIPIRLLA